MIYVDHASKFNPPGDIYVRTVVRPVAVQLFPVATAAYGSSGL